MPEIFVLSVDEGAGGSTWTELFTSEKKANAYLASWCREQWGQQGHERGLSLNDEKAVARFFEFWTEEGYSWDVAKKGLDPVQQKPHEPVKVEMLSGTKWLMLAELDSDDNDDQVLTLGMCRESIEGGYNPDPEEEMETALVLADLERLIGVFGDDADVEKFVGREDWEDRATGDLQYRARKGQ